MNSFFQQNKMQANTLLSEYQVHTFQFLGSKVFKYKENSSDSVSSSSSELDDDSTSVEYSIRENKLELKLHQPNKTKNMNLLQNKGLPGAFDNCIIQTIFQLARTPS
jgi:hypothetical protein